MAFPPKKKGKASSSKKSKVPTGKGSAKGGGPRGNFPPKAAMGSAKKKGGAKTVKPPAKAKKSGKKPPFGKSY